MSDLKMLVQHHLNKNGVIPHGDLFLHVDGKFHRFRVDGDRSGSLNGYYCIHSAPLNMAVIGCWKRDVKELVNLDSTISTSSQVIARRNRSKMKMYEQLQAQKKLSEQKIARECGRIWTKAHEASSTHPYCLSKNVKPINLRHQGTNLIIPILNSINELVSLQWIDPYGNKRFHPGGRIKRCFSRIGNANHRFVLVEGWATGATVHKCTGWTVIVCFNASNLAPVALEIKHRYPNATIIIAADNDRHTKGNPGITKGKYAAQLINAPCVYPYFPEQLTGTDFNDLARIFGNKVVNQQIKNQLDASR